MLAQYQAEGTAPLLRTDCSDDQSWERVTAAVTAPTRFGEEDQAPPCVPNLAAVDERS